MKAPSSETPEHVKCDNNIDSMISEAVHRHQEIFSLPGNPISQEEVTDKATKRFAMKELDQFDKENPNKIFGRQIKKAQKAGKGTWTRKHDSKLLNLVEELRHDWIEIAGAFEEPFATPKYLKDRYQVLLNKKLGFKHQGPSEQENFSVVKPSELYGDNWDTMTDFLVSTHADDAVNEFYMMIKDDMPELPLEPESSKRSYSLEEIDCRFDQVCEGLGQEGKEESSESFEDIINSMHSQITRDGSSLSCFEVKQDKLQEDIIDSYFNTNDSEELEQTLLKNKDFLEKVDLCKNPEEVKKRTSLFTSPIQPEQDGIVGEKLWEEKPKEEVVEILNGRISLIQSLYNQTLIELMKLQSEGQK